MNRGSKLVRTWCSGRYLAGLRFGVIAAAEHEPALRALECRTVIDVGANRGQFTLVARKLFPQATILSFEPLVSAAKVFRRVFSGDQRVILHETAIGPKFGRETIHVSGREDSSSLLPITPLQDEVFPGTAEVRQQTVEVGPLSQYVSYETVVAPALLKLDVQGYELEALKGCESLLDRFAHVYVECSFMELYKGQARADEVIAFLRERGFRLSGIYNMTYDETGRAIQGDFLLSAYRELSGDTGT